VKEIKALQDALSRVPVLSRLIVTDIIHGNPLRCLLPSDAAVESIEYGRSKHDEDVEFLDGIDEFLAANPLVQHDSSLVEKLKGELKLALDRSQLGACRT
jgi:hypothetical protein